MSGPATRRIADDLRARIQSGKLLPGALMPSEWELTRTYEVSRATARHALVILEAEGWIRVLPRRGRIVVDRRESDCGQEPVNSANGGPGA